MKTFPSLKVLLQNLFLGAVLSSFGLANEAHAQTKPSPVTAAAVAPVVVASPTPAAPAPVKSPWKLVYFAEYVGPRLENIDLGKTQGPEDTSPSYAEIDHSVKVAYAVAKNFVIGTQVRAISPFDPAKNFNFSNLRFYGSLNHVIENSVIDLQTVVDVELPTTDSSRNKGLIVRFNIKNNIELKTSLRNWSFSAMLYVSPRFYNNPTDATDLLIAIYPWVTMDIAPNWQLLFDGSFDAGHNYRETYFDFSSSDPDYLDIGPLYSLNSHIQLNLAPRFYTGNLSLKAAGIYFSVTAAL